MHTIDTNRILAAIKDAAETERVMRTWPGHAIEAPESALDIKPTPYARRPVFTPTTADMADLEELFINR